MKNRYTILLLIVGVGIMLAMLYFIGLEDVLKAIEKAKDNDRIKGIYIEAGLFTPDSYAGLQEIRNAKNTTQTSQTVQNGVIADTCFHYA